MNEVNQKEFEKISEIFNKTENFRSEIWKSCRNLIKNEYEFEAYSLILSTWNFARFNLVITSLDVNEFKKLIKINEKIFRKLDELTFETADFSNSELKNDIKTIYNPYRNIKGLEITGTVKLMALRKPDLFVMWDTDIRKLYKIPKKGTSEDYINFLIKMKEIFKDIKWDNKDKPLAKAIDEYNYYKVHSTIE